MVQHVVIMAGGAGKRLWPASIGSRPKQFMTVAGNKTLFRGTLDRAFGLGISGKILVVTHVDHVDAALAECRSLSEQQKSRIIILAEPVARNTAPALALAASRLELDGLSSDSTLIMAADHLISPPEAFAESVEAASIEAENGYIVPYGIPPREAATGYGYIETGKKQGAGFEVISFREKPDEQTAKKYLASGKHYWNAGLFTYRSDLFMSELGLCAPDVKNVFTQPSEDWFVSETVDSVTIFRPSELLKSLYSTCPAISVDYAVMERSTKIRMVKALFDWNDVGSWDVIAEINSPPEAPVYAFESDGNFVYSDIPVALCGVKDLIVVVANGRVMVSRKGKTQLVKNAAEAEQV